VALTETPQSFELSDLAGRTVSFPTGRPALIAFVKADCETCNLAAPILEAFHHAYGGAADIVLLGQSGPDNGVFADRHGLSMALLDETECRTSLAWDIEAVPALFWCDGAGHVLTRFEGFVRAEWAGLDAEMAAALGQARADVAWPDFPEWRPGCGSRHLDPAIHDRLRAEAGRSGLAARRIEIAPGDDASEFMFDQGFSDGLPLMAPTPERVQRFLDATPLDPQHTVAVMAPNMAPATVEKLAINAVMAGCKPDYMPVIIAAVEAICTDEFNIHGVTATTMGASPVMVVNGPIRERLGMNMGLGALGAGNRANATIGRAVRLAVRNIGGGRPGGVDRSTQGNPMKYTMCFAEWEERAPWAPLHVERGFAREDSVVTVFAMTGGPVQIVDQESRDPDQLAGSLGLGLEGVFLPKLHKLPVDALLVVAPEHVDTLMRDGPYSKARLRERIQSVTMRPLREMVADEVSGAGLAQARAAEMDAETLDTLVPKFAGPEHIHLVVAGSEAGKFSSAFHGWATGDIGSVSVSRRIAVSP
jgi:hypothetical protein